MVDAKRCDVTGEYFLAKDVVELDFVPCREINGELVKMDVHPRLAKRLQKVLCPKPQKHVAKKKVKAKKKRGPKKGTKSPGNTAKPKVSNKQGNGRRTGKPSKDKPDKRRRTWSEAARQRQSWIGKRAAELRLKGLKHSDAMKAANKEWDQRSDKQPNAEGAGKRVDGRKKRMEWMNNRRDELIKQGLTKSDAWKRATKEYKAMKGSDQVPKVSGEPKPDTQSEPKDASVQPTGSAPPPTAPTGDMKREAWVSTRIFELINEEGLSKDEARNRAAKEWEDVAEKRRFKPKKRNGAHTRKGEEQRIQAHNEYMQKVNGEASPARLVRCAICNKNPVEEEGMMCPVCEEAFEDR